MWFVIFLTDMIITTIIIHQGPFNLGIIFSYHLLFMCITIVTDITSHVVGK
jgi:hypothetical protein